MQLHRSCREPDTSSLNGLASFFTRLAVLHSNGSRRPSFIIEPLSYWTL